MFAMVLLPRKSESQKVRKEKDMNWRDGNTRGSAPRRSKDLRLGVQHWWWTDFVTFFQEVDPGFVPNSCTSAMARVKCCASACWHLLTQCWHTPKKLPCFKRHLILPCIFAGAKQSRWLAFSALFVASIDTCASFAEHFRYTRLATLSVLWIWSCTLGHSLLPSHKGAREWLWAMCWTLACYNSSMRFNDIKSPQTQETAHLCLSHLRRILRIDEDEAWLRALVILLYLMISELWCVLMHDADSFLGACNKALLSSDAGKAAAQELYKVCNMLLSRIATIHHPRPSKVCHTACTFDLAFGGKMHKKRTCCE